VAQFGRRNTRDDVVMADARSSRARAGRRELSRSGERHWSARLGIRQTGKAYASAVFFSRFLETPSARGVKAARDAIARKR
jgi:hypothetical protein